MEEISYQRGFQGGADAVRGNIIEVEALVKSCLAELNRLLPDSRAYKRSEQKAFLQGRIDGALSAVRGRGA